jgi:putative intracellular protease/amidase
MNPLKILFVTTSHEQLGDTNYRTGVWLEELATPYYIFTEAGVELTIASPNGGPVPLDPKSESIIVATQRTKRFLKDEVAMNFISNSIPLEAIKAEDFDAVFLTGGHGPMWDIADNKSVKRLLEAFNNDNKPIASVCHGVVGLLSLQGDDGELLIRGKHLTAFSNSEEESAGLTKVVPFLLETRLISLGAEYSKAANYTGHVVIDANIITGQNAASSEEVAKKIVALLKEVKQKPMLQT